MTRKRQSYWLLLCPLQGHRVSPWSKIRLSCLLCCQRTHLCSFDGSSPIISSDTCPAEFSSDQKFLELEAARLPLRLLIIFFESSMLILCMYVLIARVRDQARTQALSRLHFVNLAAGLFQKTPKRKITQLEMRIVLEHNVSRASMCIRIASLYSCFSCLRP